MGNQFLTWRQLCAEAGGKRELLSYPYSGNLVDFNFCRILFLAEQDYFRACGLCNWKCAKLAGININKTKIIVYAISGFMSALAGLILLSRSGSAQPTLGSGYELDAIAAVALGGTSMSGGRGKIYGTLIGVLIIAVLNNGLNILGVSSYYQDVIKGFVILIAVLSDRKR